MNEHLKTIVAIVDKIMTACAPVAIGLTEGSYLYEIDYLDMRMSLRYTALPERINIPISSNYLLERVGFWTYRFRVQRESKVLALADHFPVFGRPVAQWRWEGRESGDYALFQSFDNWKGNEHDFSADLVMLMVMA